MTKGRKEFRDRVIEYTEQYNSGVDTFTERSFLNLPAHKKAQRYVDHINKIGGDQKKFNKFLESIVQLGGGQKKFEEGNNKMLNADIEKYMRIILNLQNSQVFQDMSPAQRQESIKAAFKATK